MTSKEKDFMDRLVRRCDYLKVRTESAKAQGKDLSYDLAEAAALAWAIRTLKTLLQME